MPSGGARNRSGPPPEENSLNSARKGLVLTALPAEGYQGKIPDFPLPADAERGDREQDMWEWVWRTPQATAWITQPWRWYIVAMWVRTAVGCEQINATAAEKNALHRFADQIGLTPAGLKENGWKISAPVVEEPAPAAKPAARPAVKSTSARSRFKVIDGGSAA